MSTSFRFLLASLVLNGGLIFAWIRLASTAAEKSSSDDAAHAQAAAAPEGATGTTTNPQAHAQTASLWSRINRADLDELSRQLRAAGFSNPEMRAILLQRILEKYDTSGFASGQSRPYWQPEWVNLFDAKTQKEYRAKIYEQSAALRKYAYNAENLPEDPERVDYAKRRYGDIPMDKLQAMTKLEDDYRELLEKQSEARLRPGESDDRFREAQRLLQKEKERDIAALLSPEEYADYQMRSSPTAENLRQRLSTFQTTEEEYKLIFALQKAADEQMSDKTMSADTLRTLNNEVVEQVKAALGPDRAADFEEAYKQNKDETARLVARLGLPPRITAQIRTARQDYATHAQAIRANNQLSAAERASQLATLAAEARAELTTALGPDGFAAYEDLKGSWLQELEKSKPGKP